MTVIVSGAELVLVTRYVQVIAEPTAIAGPVGASASSTVVGASGLPASTAFLIWMPAPVPVTRFAAVSATVLPLTQPGTPVVRHRPCTVTVLVSVPAGAVPVAPATSFDV